MTNSKYNAHTEPLFKELEMLKVSDIFDVQCMKFWYKFVNKSLPGYFGTMFTFNNELYQIETRGQNQLHLFPTRTCSARNVLRHRIPDLLHEYPRAITQKAKTHSIEWFVKLLKAYTIGFYSYECTDINCYSCERNVRWFSLFWLHVPASSEFNSLLVTYMWHMLWCLYVWLSADVMDSHNCFSEWLTPLAMCSPLGGLYVSGQVWP